MKLKSKKEKGDIVAGIKIDIKANTKDFAKKIRAIKKEVKDLNKEQKKAIQ